MAYFFSRETFISFLSTLMILVEKSYYKRNKENLGNMKELKKLIFQCVIYCDSVTCLNQCNHYYLTRQRKKKLFYLHIPLLCKNEKEDQHEHYSESISSNHVGSISTPAKTRTRTGGEEVHQDHSPFNNQSQRRNDGKIKHLTDYLLLYHLG